MPSVAFPPTDVWGKETVRENSNEEEKPTDSPVAADTEEASAPVPTGLDDRERGPATGSLDRLLHHHLGGRLAPFQWRNMKISL